MTRRTRRRLIYILLWAELLCYVSIRWIHGPGTRPYGGTQGKSSHTDG